MYICIYIERERKRERERESVRETGFNSKGSHTKDSKIWYLMPPCLTISKGKVQRSRECYSN